MIRFPLKCVRRGQPHYWLLTHFFWHLIWFEKAKNLNRQLIFDDFCPNHCFQTMFLHFKYSWKWWIRLDIFVLWCYSTKKWLGWYCDNVLMGKKLKCQSTTNASKDIQNYIMQNKLNFRNWVVQHNGVSKISIFGASLKHIQTTKR